MLIETAPMDFISRVCDESSKQRGTLIKLSQNNRYYKYDFFYDFAPSDLTALADEFGLASFRAKQMLQWQQKGASDFSEMTNLSKDLRAKLSETFKQCGLKVVQELHSQDDDSTKYLYELHDRQRIETVLMRYRFGLSCCVSSEAGCLMGCAFCASSIAGYGRKLSSGEMFAQVAQSARMANQRIRNVTVMGTGEPLNNLEALIDFLKRLHDPEFGLGMSYRHMTVSTCGLVDKMLLLAAEVLPITLSISLHAPNQKLREQLMPIARLYHFDDLLAAVQEWTSRTGRRVTFEYTLFKDVNDSREQAKELASKLRDCNCHVNLIPVNVVAGLDFEPSSKEAVYSFQKELSEKGINVTLRRSLGLDVNAACGQLRRQFADDEAEGEEE
ncbi:MAG: 23S rRNA (adenine(2503)-C(2))-methyltransferase RlmN [Eubacteriales bacterium]|nr:23S rRNA (adenine(2503)-C(2))-methyltransferase RlmN [Eubacteriales bacterium]